MRFSLLGEMLLEWVVGYKKAELAGSVELLARLSPLSLVQDKSGTKVCLFI